MKRRKPFTLAAATAAFAVLPGIAQAREGIDTGLDADGAGASPAWKAHSNGTAAAATDAPPTRS